MTLFLAGALTGILILFVLIRLAGLRLIIERREKRYNPVKQKRRKMLHPVQQDVLSALVNQGVPFRQAEQLVSEIDPQGRCSFDELFRLAMSTITPGKRKAAA